MVAFRSRETWEGEEWVITTDKQTMMDDFRGWSEHVQNIISNVQKPNIWALFMHPPAPYYSRGRICLLGDAAHASTPHCGAGAGMAIEDSYVLSTLVGRVGIDGDLEKISAELKRRMNWIWDEDLPAESRQAFELLQKFKKEHESARL